MNWAIYLFISLGLITQSIGCTSIGKMFYHEPHEITIWDAKKLYPFRKHSSKHRNLTLQQSQLINEIYGEEISHEGELIAYYQARARKPLRHRANIFIVHAGGELGQLDILVSTTGRWIETIMIKDSPELDGKPVIPNEFIEQFIGRSLANSWELAQNPSDLVTLPAKIRPITGYPRTSKEITNAIRKVLVWARVLQIQ
jgi:hypothetical protein